MKESRTFEKCGTATVKEAEFINLFSRAKQELSIRAAPTESYLLAGTLGRSATRRKRLSYKMLSKFIHPTAMRIQSSPDESRNALQRYCFFV
jgi:hypothetical protein